MPEGIGYSNGHIIRNPSTGEQRIMRDGVWEPYEGGGELQLGQAEGISATPGVDKNIELMPWLPDETSPSLPFSMLDVAEAGPGFGGALGTFLGVPGGLGGMAIGGSLGSGAGEAFRQLFRRAVGYAPATGVGQEYLDLDPNSPEAAALGIFDEMAVGGATELVSTPAARAASAHLMSRGTDRLVDAITPQASRFEREGLRELVEKGGIAEQLPGPGLNPLKTQQYMADELAELANVKGRDVATRYADDVPVSELGTKMSEVEGTLRKKARLREFTPEHETPELVARDTGLVDPEGSPIITETMEDVTKPATFEGTVAKREAKALDERAALVQAQRESKIELGEEFSLSSVHKLRKAAAKDAKDAAARAFKMGQREQPVAAKAIAAMDERGELAKALHGASPESGIRGTANWVPSGEEVDRVFHAAKTAAEQAAGGRPASHFVERWLLSRMIGGPLGTAVGAVAQSSAFWSAVRGKNYQRLAKMIKAGNESGAEQLIRGIAASMGDEGVPEENRDIGSGG